MLTRLVERSRPLLGRPEAWLTTLLIAYPLIEAFFRRYPIPVIDNAWDDLTLFASAALAGWVWFSSTPRRTPILRALWWAFLVGAAYITLDPKAIVASVNGYRDVFEYALAFYAGLYLMREPHDLRVYFRLLLMVGALAAGLGVYQYVRHVPVPATWVDASEGPVTRAFSFVQSPNALGDYLALLLPINAGLFFSSRGWRRLGWAAMAGLIALALLFTLSRGAWLALLLALAVVAALYDRRLLAGLVVAAILAGLFVAPVRERIGALVSPQYVTKSERDGRIHRWEGAWNQMRANPLFGDGLGHYGGAVAQREFGTPYVDNFYAKTLAEMGLTGLAVLLWLYTTVLLAAYRAWRALRGSPNEWLAVGLLAALLVPLIHNSIENIFEIPFLNTYFWLLAGWSQALPFLAGKTGFVEPVGIAEKGASV